eukprot:8306903-Pyramimonas_sp.AAC.2
MFHKGLKKTFCDENCSSAYNIGHTTATSTATATATARARAQEADVVAARCAGRHADSFDMFRGSEMNDCSMSPRGRDELTRAAS